MIDICIHCANLLYLASFLARDMLWLRVLTCLGLVFGIVFFTCQPIPLYGASAWHAVFLGINGFQIWRLLHERRQLALTAEQEQAAKGAFRDLTREELVTLLSRCVVEGPNRIDPRHATDCPLNAEERALREIAFCRLSRDELLNLLTRRMWDSLKRRSPVRWQRRSPGAAPGAGAANGTARPESAHGAAP